MTETQNTEFEKAVDAKVNERFAAFKAELLGEMRGAAARSDGVDISSVLDILAMKIGEVSDQGTNRKRVAPEELAERARAYERMGALLLEAQKLPVKQKPLYRVISKFYVDNRVVEPFQRLPDKSIIETRIYFDGEPSEAIRPVSANATAIWKEYVRYLGGEEAAKGLPKAAPAWVTNRGVVIAGNPTATARERGLLQEAAEPIYVEKTPELGEGGLDQHSAVEIVSPTDPRATKIPVLGTIAAPATVGQSSSRVL